MKNFEQFETISDNYLPLRGEGTTKAQQIVTAVNKLVYKWFNDGDVYDNVNSGLEGWGNDLSSYANWLYKNTFASDILCSIYDCYNDSDYEELLYRLCENILNEKYLAQMNEEEIVGSIYDCDGPFEWSYEYDEYEDDEY